MSKIDYLKSKNRELNSKVYSLVRILRLEKLEFGSQHQIDIVKKIKKIDLERDKLRVEFDAIGKIELYEE